MTDKTFGLITFSAGIVMLAASVVATARVAPRVECQEDEVVATSNGRDHDVCVNIDELDAFYAKAR